MSRVNERLGIASQELKRLAADRAEQQACIQSRRSEISALESHRTELEQQTATGQATLAALRERSDLPAQNASQHIANVATLEALHPAAAAGLHGTEGLG